MGRKLQGWQISFEAGSFPMRAGQLLD